MAEKKAKVNPENEQKSPKCFVVSEIGGDGTSERTRADWVYNGVVKPVATDFGYDVLRADEISAPGMIDTQVINLVHDSELVIADLTGHNPNAFYELAVRHMAGKPVIHMIEHNDKIPFDVGAFRTIQYGFSSYSDFEKAKFDLSSHIRHVQESPGDVDNPILTARTKLEAYAQASSEEKYLLDRVEELSSRLLTLERGGFDSLKETNKNKLLDTLEGIDETEYSTVVAEFSSESNLSSIGKTIMKSIPPIKSFEILGNLIVFTIYGKSRQRVERVEEMLRLHPGNIDVHRL